MSLLSIVLITKNQRWNVERLVNSALRAVERIPDAEVVLVDSASDDGTVEAARRFPIRAYRLQPDQTLTAAAGRYLGQIKSTGDLILFLDGDMELRPGWLDEALALMAQRTDIAAVSGQVIDLPKTASGSTSPSSARDASEAHSRVVKVPHGGGAAMYRRSVLDEVGPFNPFLYSDEEPELCLRIRAAGYAVVRIERPMVNHYTDPGGAISTLAGRRRRHLYLGPGQAIRRHLGSPLLWPYVRERGFGVVPALGLAVGAASLSVSIFSTQARWFGLWLFASAGLFATDALRKRSPYRASFSMVQRVFFAEGTVIGFFSPPDDPARYPLKYDVVQERQPGGITQ